MNLTGLWNRSSCAVAVAAWLAVPGVLPLDAATVVTVSGRQILVNGEPLIVRGVRHQPTPIGENPSQAPPWGDYCSLAWGGIYVRDLPNLRRMGANVVRV